MTEHLALIFCLPIINFDLYTDSASKIIFPASFIFVLFLSHSLVCSYLWFYWGENFSVLHCRVIRHTSMFLHSLVVSIQFIYVFSIILMHPFSLFLRR